MNKEKMILMGRGLSELVSNMNQSFSKDNKWGNVYKVYNIINEINRNSELLQKVSDWVYEKNEEYVELSNNDWLNRVYLRKISLLICNIGDKLVDKDKSIDEKLNDINGLIGDFKREFIGFLGDIRSLEKDDLTLLGFVKWSTKMLELMIVGEELIDGYEDEIYLIPLWIYENLSENEALLSLDSKEIIKKDIKDMCLCHGCVTFGFKK